jgi:peptidoglycan/xylan/chitin deacetylase (PgdA/CDA1 family)
MLPQWLSRRAGLTTLAKDAAKQLLGRNFILPLAPPQKYVFVFHDISHPDAVWHSPSYSTTPERFRAQIDLLSSLFEWRPLDELMASGRPERHQAALTFDDGFESVRSFALPLLRERRIPFTAFVCRHGIEDNFLPPTAAVILERKRERTIAKAFTAIDPRQRGYLALTHTQQEFLIENRTQLQREGILEEKAFLNEKDVRALAGAGVHVDSHSCTHRVLSSCSDSQLTVEIDGNREFLRDSFDIGGEHFALPFGKREHYDARVLDRLFASGVRYAYTTNPTFIMARDRERRLIPRVTLLNETSSQVLFYLNRPFLRRIDI